MLYPSYHSPSLIDILKGPIAIKALCLWFGFLVFFFSPEIVHAEFLDRLELVNHLRQGHYSKLEKILAHQESLYQKNKIPEEHVEAAYSAFANSASDLSQKLDQWIERDIQSGTAQLARGIYYWNIGWTARGGAYMPKTPPERVNAMKEYFSISWEDLKFSAHKKKSGLPYRFLIGIAMSFGDKKGVKQYFHQGLQADPKSFAVRWSYIYSLVPWWSGLSEKDSIEAITTFIQNEINPQLNNNPNFKPFHGFPDYVRAEMFDRKGEDDHAISYYQSALKYGGRCLFPTSLGEALFHLHRYEEALTILTEALQTCPQEANIHDYRARTFEALQHPEQALTEQAQAIALDELDPGNLRRYSSRLRKQGRLEEAKVALTQALTYGSRDHRVLGSLGRLYLEDFHDPTEALPYLKQAVELKPEKAWHLLNYGWALNKLGKCKAVGILEGYKYRCMASGNCSSHDLEWAKKTSQRMIWKEGCWREHPTLKILKHLAKWLPEL